MLIFPVLFPTQFFPSSWLFRVLNVQMNYAREFLLCHLLFDRLHSSIWGTIFLAILYWLFKHSKQKSTEIGKRKINLDWIYRLYVLKVKLQTLFMCPFQEYSGYITWNYCRNIERHSNYQSSNPKKPKSYQKEQRLYNMETKFFALAISLILKLAHP